MLSGSTSGVIDRNSAMIERETSEYSAMSPGSTVAVGHSRSARAVGMAECTP